MKYKGREKSETEKEYQNNVIINYIMKGLGIIFGLLNTRFTLQYLGGSLYGMWVTITAIISCMSAGDLGIGNGLRNELATAYANSDEKRQYDLIKTAVQSLMRISIVLFFLSILIEEILIKFNILQSDLRIPFYITTAFFCINLVLGLGQSISCAVQAFSVLFIILLDIAKISADLIKFSFVYGICCTLPNFLIIIRIIKSKPSIFKGIYDKKLKKAICNIGIQFFVLQICYVVLYYSDNIIINYYFEPEQVTQYSILTNIYNTGISVFSTILIAFWSAVTFHIAKKDIMWIKKKIHRLLILWSVFSLGVIAVSLFINTIIRFWLGKQAFNYDFKIVLLFAIYTIVYAFSSIFVYVANGSGKILVEMILSIVGAILNIPLSIYFACVLNMGIFGVKLATFICVLITAIVIPIQVFLFLRSLSKNDNSTISYI